MQHDQRPHEPEIELSAILPIYRQLVSDYALYLGLLGETIDSRERTENLQAQIRSLLNADYARHIPELAQAEELTRISERLEFIEPATQIFSLEDITPIRQLAARNLGDSEPDPLFLKLCAFEKVMSQNTGIFGGPRVSETLPISELQSHTDKELRALTAMEFACCVSLAHEAKIEALAATEKKLHTREDRVKEYGAALVEEIGKQPALQLALRHQTGAVSPQLVAFNSWALRSYQSSEQGHRDLSQTSAPQFTRPYLEWRHRILGTLAFVTRTEDVLARTDLTASLENKLGEGSSGNHFDVFLLGRQGSPMFYSHFHQPLCMQIFLTLANPSCDALIFQGSEGTLSSSRLSRGIDFLVPAMGGVVKIPEVVRSILDE